jgi:Flp pilus assembly protein TadD
MSKRIALWAAFSMCAAIGFINLAGTSSYAADVADTSAPLATPEPTTAVEHNKRAEELAKHGRWTEAISEHELAVAAEPNNKTFKSDLSACLLRCGDTLMGKKKYESAAGLYKRALEADAGNLSAKSGLSEALKLASTAQSSL